MPDKRDAGCDIEWAVRFPKDKRQLSTMWTTRTEKPRLIYIYSIFVLVYVEVDFGIYRPVAC